MGSNSLWKGRDLLETGGSQRDPRGPQMAPGWAAVCPPQSKPWRDPDLSKVLELCVLRPNLGQWRMVASGTEVLSNNHFRLFLSPQTSPSHKDNMLPWSLLPFPLNIRCKSHFVMYAQQNRSKIVTVGTTHFKSGNLPSAQAPRNNSDRL